MTVALIGAAPSSLGLAKSAAIRSASGYMLPKPKIATSEPCRVTRYRSNGMVAPPALPFASAAVAASRYRGYATSSLSEARSAARIGSPGTRIATAPCSRDVVDLSSMDRNAAPLVGARYVKPGILANIGMSNAPECVLSAPEMPVPNTRSVTGVPLRDNSCCNWSKVRWKNVALVASTGVPPAFAMPEANATACSSVMPVST